MRDVYFIWNNDTNNSNTNKLTNIIFPTSEYVLAGNTCLLLTDLVTLIIYFVCFS